MEELLTRSRSCFAHATEFEFLALYRTLETLRSKLRVRSGADSASEGRLAVLLEFADDAEESIRDLQRLIDDLEG